MRGIAVSAALLVVGCKFSHRANPDAPLDADDEPDARVIDAVPLPPAPLIQELRDRNPTDGELVQIRGVVTAILPCFDAACRTAVFLSDPVAAITGEPRANGIVALGLTGDLQHEIGGAYTEGVQGDYVDVTAHVGSVTLAGATAPMRILEDGAIADRGSRRFAPAPAIPYALLADPAQMAPYEAMVVRLEAVPIATYGPAAEVFGGGRVVEQPGFPPFAPGVCDAKVAGVVAVGAEPTVYARVPSDVDPSAVTAGCPPHGDETQPDTCRDGIDNDWNGATDCPSNVGCRDLCMLWDDAAPSMTISQLQQASPLPTASVKLRSVVVMAIKNESIWVMDQNAFTAFGGIRIGELTAADTAGLAIGTRIDVVAHATELTFSYGGRSITERYLRFAHLAAGATGAPVPPPATSATELTFNGGAWDGELVRLSNHRLTSGFDTSGHGVISDGSSTVLLSTSFGPLSLIPGTCFSRIDGIVLGRCGSRPATDPCVVIAPRSSADLTEGTACP